MFLLPNMEAITDNDELKFFPIEHASLVINYKTLTIYVDPIGKPDQYRQFAKPDLILITHTHDDHFDPDLLKSLKSPNTILIGNQAAVTKLGYGEILKNGEKTTIKGVEIESIPMYNTSKERLSFHPKGDGNGYVINFGDKRVYISGDTEDIPAMRHLKNIDYAFVCMNLPFTMTPEQAASAVIDFKPKVVYPYHYRQANGFADIEKFKTLVNAGCNSEVVFLNWYSGH